MKAIVLLLACRAFGFAPTPLPLRRAGTCVHQSSGVASQSLEAASEASERTVGDAAAAGDVDAVATSLLASHELLEILDDTGGDLPPVKVTRLTMLSRDDLDEQQVAMYDRIVSSRVKAGIPVEKVLDANGAMRGPWNAEITSPGCGEHLEQLATAIRNHNSLDPNLYEVRWRRKLM